MAMPSARARWGLWHAGQQRSTPGVTTSSFLSARICKHSGILDQFELVGRRTMIGRGSVSLRSSCMLLLRPAALARSWDRVSCHHFSGVPARRSGARQLPLFTLRAAAVEPPAAEQPESSAYTSFKSLGVDERLLVRPASRCSMLFGCPTGDTCSLFPGSPPGPAPGLALSPTPGCTFLGPTQLANTSCCSMLHPPAAGFARQPGHCAAH